MEFDSDLSQWAEVSWSDTAPCLVHPDSCTGGATILAWITMASACTSQQGIFGSQGGGGITDTEGISVECMSSGRSVK